MIGPASAKGSDLWVVTEILKRAGVSPENAEYQAKGLLEDAREQTEIRREAWLHRRGK